MKTNTRFFHLIAWLFFLFMTPNVYAEIQGIINFQGYLTDMENNAVSDGNYTITFSLWDGNNETQDTKLWEDTYSVQVSKGIYSVSLGSITAFSDPVGNSSTNDALTFAIPYYLGIKIGTEWIKYDDALLPLTTLPYTFRANTASGKAISIINQDYTLSDADDYLDVSGDTNLTLRSASGQRGRMITIRKNDSNSTSLTLTTISGETINGTNRDPDNGGTALVLMNQYEKLTLISDGSNWIQLGIMLISEGVY